MSVYTPSVFIWISLRLRWASVIGVVGADGLCYVHSHSTYNPFKLP
jgi:hypothetical protein